VLVTERMDKFFGQIGYRDQWGRRRIGGGGNRIESARRVLNRAKNGITRRRILKTVADNPARGQFVKLTPGSTQLPQGQGSGYDSCDDRQDRS
jgi:hypothetical protein